MTLLDDEPFLLEFQDDREIWVKDRSSGHVLCFPIADGGERIDDLHRIDLHASSAYDGSRLIPSARRAARAYLERSRTCAARIGRMSDARRSGDARGLGRQGADAAHVMPEKTFRSSTRTGNAASPAPKSSIF